MRSLVQHDGIKRWLVQAAMPLADLLYPPSCAGCGTAIARTPGVCSSCWRSLSFLERPFCEVMGSPLPADSAPGTLSLEAMRALPPFRRLRGAVLYEGLGTRLVASLKYADRTDLVPLMAGWMDRAGAESWLDADLVVPVPLHPRRLLRRRFNQSAELARRLARQRALRFDPLSLRRVRATPSQVGLGAAERERNMRGAFAVTPRGKALVAGRRVLLVDDVYTTGATVAAATRALVRAGAGSVDVLVFARVAAEGG